MATFQRFLTVTFIFTLLVLATASRSGRSSSSRPRVDSSVYFNRKYASMCVQDPDQVRKVYQNHFRQLNRCSVRGLKMERTPDTQLFFGPVHVKGESDVDKVFSDTCKPRSKGGYNGIKFQEKIVFIVGNVANVQWTATAPFLKEPYDGADAYVTCGDKMLAIVSTFDEKELKLKY